MLPERLKIVKSANNYIREQSEIIKQSHSQTDVSQVKPLLTIENQDFVSNLGVNFDQYLVNLGQVWRWQDHVYKDVASKVQENNFHHTLNMLKILSEIKILKLSSINYSEAELMILSHDGGEIITGDLTQHAQNIDKDEVKFIKNIETRLFSLVVLENGLKNYPQEKNYVRNIYNRYNNRDTNISDTESHLVKLIDIFDGNETGIKRVYKKDILFEKYGGNPPKDPDEIIQGLIQREIDQARIVLNSIDNIQDRQKLYGYLVENHLSIYKNPSYGYQDIYMNYENEIISLNSSIT